MKIEAVTVCVGYGDFLAEAAKYNAGMFDQWIIVTSEFDTETREVCRRHSLQTLLSEDHRRGGCPFNKGLLVERGLQHLSSDGWRLHIDADIILPGRTSHLLRAAHLDEQKIYGCDRLMVKSYEQWKQLAQSGYMSHDYHHRVDVPKSVQIGSRWVHHNAGYVPIGFFQLWHSSADEWRGVRIRPYPTSHNAACRTDVQHALQWDRRHRESIPELIVAHLESESLPKGVNWNGRRSKRFCAESCANAPDGNYLRS